MKKGIDGKKIFIYFAFISLALSLVYTGIMAVISPNGEIIMESGEKIKMDYILMFFQCLLGFLAMLLPSILERRINLSIPSNMIFLYFAFLYFAIYLGEVRSFYYLVPHWDTILHTFSGAMIGALGFSIISFLNKSEDINLHLTPLFVAIFAFCFSVTLGVVWEVYEFSFDKIMGLNMQKFALADGTLLKGQEALIDTMKDLIVDGVGAFIISVIGYISLKYKKGWIERLRVKIKRKK